METEVIFTLVTALVTIILGVISKKLPFIHNNLIPIQNLLIGIIAAVAFWIMNGNFNLAITTAGLLAGGTYDIVNNINKLISKKDTIK